MDFMKLFGTVMAVLFHPGAASKINGQRICRRGTERPCYKVSYIQESRRRLTFEEARQACWLDGGELLSIETDSEQRLIERFIQQLHAGDGDFWIGLRRGTPRARTPAGGGGGGGGGVSLGCPSQYYWLDGSKAKFRNWHWDEPSCGGEMCVVLYHQPSAPPDEEGHFLFQWNDDNCNTKNNYICKYAKEKAAGAATEKGNTEHAAPTPRPSFFSTTESDERIKIGLSESSVSLSDQAMNVSYILYATIPALLLLLLFATAGFFCYRQHSKRRKTQTEGSRSKQWASSTAGAAAAASCPVQGPYAFSDISKHFPQVAPDGGAPAYPCAPPPDWQCGDYENVASAERESGFVTNDIYESCRAQSQMQMQMQMQRQRSGWVDNEIYG